MNSPVDRMLSSVQQLPSIPKALREIMDTLNDEDAGVSDITGPLSKDPVLAAKVLRMSNAAHFGLPRQVGSVEEATLLVGMNAVRTMVIASGLMGSFDAIPGFDMKRFWTVSLLAGSLARDIAKMARADAELAYTSALMHGLGVLAIQRAFPEAASDIDKICPTCTASERAKTEMNTIGFHHGEVGAEVASNWHLPEAIGTAIRFYPYPQRGVASRLSVVVFSAVLLANDLISGKSPEQWGSTIPDECFNKLEVAREAIADFETTWLQYKESSQAIVS